MDQKCCRSNFISFLFTGDQIQSINIVRRYTQINKNIILYLRRDGQLNETNEVDIFYTLEPTRTLSPHCFMRDLLICFLVLSKVLIPNSL